MDVVFDSNIFRADIPLRSRDVDLVLDYLKKTNSALVIPQVILDEVLGLYSRVLTERVSDLRKSITNIQLAFVEGEVPISLEEIDIESQEKKYLAFIKDRLGIREENIIPYNTSHLIEVARRATRRIKPVGEKGQGFRDTIIWLAMRDYACKMFDKQIAFISSNVDDFANSAKSDLDESLIKECETFGIKIYYFKSIREFIEKHSSRIDRINYDWLKLNVNYEDLVEMAIVDMNKTPRESPVKWFEKTRNIVSTGNYKIVKGRSVKESDLFVYEMVNGNLVVNFTLQIELEAEFEYMMEDSRSSLYDSFNSISRSYSVTARAPFEIQGYFAITVKDDCIISSELTGVNQY